MERAYYEFANHIILQAVKDYRNACKRLVKNYNNKSAKNTKEEVERFFHSTWFGELTQVDPDKLIEQLLEEVNM